VIVFSDPVWATPSLLFAFDANGDHDDPVVNFGQYSHYYCGEPTITFIDSVTGVDNSDTFDFWTELEEFSF
jgi:hypothetical protein